jgi:crotonobetainyl-CoA:carnitine CoA-transferase CaiB-like acyl-CoA transferase
LAARILGDLGADVIKIEASWARGPAEVPREAALSRLYPENDPGDEPYNREASFNKLNRNKRSLTLELDNDSGRAIFERLVENADLVIENFSPRVMPKLGLDYERLRALNPEILYTTMPGFGRTGPYRDWLAFGPLIEAASGLSAQMGYRDSGPYRSGLAFPDPVTALHAVAGTLTALYDRESSQPRRGTWIEVPMLESMIGFVGDEILASQLRGRAPSRQGNRTPGRAPQGCYPTRGDDRWIAISVGDDATWRELCVVSAAPADWPALDLTARRRREDDIDQHLAAFTGEADADALAAQLQGRGIAAAVVADADDLLRNEQLASRGFWIELEHSKTGRRIYPGLPIHFGLTQPSFRRAAPQLGEHGREVLRELLGASEEELAQLEADGHLRTRPPEGATLRGVRKQPSAEAGEPP